MNVEDLPGWPPKPMITTEKDLCAENGHEKCEQVADLNFEKNTITVCSCWCHKAKESI